MLGVRLERDGVVCLADAQQDERDREIDQGRHDGQREADPHLLDGPRGPEAARRRDGDAHRREEDQGPLDPAREVLGLRVAVRVVLVLRPRSHGQHRQRHDRADEVDDRLDGVGQQPDGAGQPVRRRLERDGRDGGGYRQPRVAPEVRRSHGSQDTRAQRRLPAASGNTRSWLEWVPEGRRGRERGALRLQQLRGHLRDPRPHDVVHGQVREVRLALEPLHHLHQAVRERSDLGPVDLVRVAGQDDPGPLAGARQHQLHVLLRQVLAVVHDDGRVVDGPAPQVVDRRDFEQVRLQQVLDRRVRGLLLLAVVVRHLVGPAGVVVQPAHDEVEVVDDGLRPRRHLLAEVTGQESQLAPGFGIQPVHLDPRDLAGAKHLVGRQQRDERLAGPCDPDQADNERLVVQDELVRARLFRLQGPKRSPFLVLTRRR